MLTTALVDRQTPRQFVTPSRCLICDARTEHPGLCERHAHDRSPDCGCPYCQPTEPPRIIRTHHS